MRVILEPADTAGQIRVAMALQECGLAEVTELETSEAKLWVEIRAIRTEINEILEDQNDINESVRARLDVMSEAMAEIQPKQSPRPHIGFV